MPRTFHRSQSGWVVAVLAIALCLLALTAAIGPRRTSAATSVFINEIHYDNTGTDAGEAVEVAGPAGTDLTGWSIVLYNGAGGAVYDTDALSGVIPNQQNGFGTVSLTYPSNGIQNGSPDGIALVNPSSAVVQFLSYEGSFTAVGGAANGMMSTDIGVSEASTEAVGQSLRLSGTGCTYEDFTWNTPATASFGAVNTGQTFSCGGGTTLSINDVSMAEGDSGTTIFTFTVSLSSPAGAGGVTFDIATQDNTAMVSDNDYVLKSLTGQTITSGNSNYMFDVTVNGDMSVEPNETFFVNVTNITGATAGDVQGVGAINNDDFILTPIHDIQGPGASSPLSGSVTTTGIVTGAKSNGFFIQEPDATVDANPATSEGIFVFTSSSPPAAAMVGNLVRVTGTISEFVPSADPLQPPLTELTSPAVVQLSTGNPLPAAIPLNAAFPDPAGAHDQLERLEGMRVNAASLTVAGPTLGSVNEPNATATSSGVFYGVITGVARPFREAGIQSPDPPPSGTIPPIPRFDSNPERIRVDSDGLVGGLLLDVRTGAVVMGLIGPLDYSFRTYSILPDPGSMPIVDNQNAITATPVATPMDREFTVGSYNLERFFDTVNDPGIGEPVLTAAVFNNRLNKASLGIRNFLKFPDILGVVEVENLSTLQALAARISNDAVANSQPDPLYQAYLVEGNDLGGIDVGFLAKTSIVTGSTPRVSVTSVTQQNAGELFVNPDSSTELLNDRPPLVLVATVNSASTSFAVTVIVNHMRSLNDVSSLAAGSNGWATTGERVRAKRQKQAESLASLVQARQTADPAERIILVGDFNAFEFNDGFGDSMSVIQGTPTPDNETAVPGDGIDLVTPDLVNLFTTAPASERYSFVFDGNAQSLDHIVVNQVLITDTLSRRVEHPRINADFPETARNGVTSMEMNVERLADHDPIVGYFEVAIPCAIICPQNVNVSNDAGQCGATVIYPSPTTSGDCGNVVCSPASGSFFPVGTTTVTCEDQPIVGESPFKPAGAPTAGCGFTVTVNDTQPPVFANGCPANVYTAAAASCPIATSKLISYTYPAATDNCPGVTVTCNPPTGSTFPTGTTTVTCTATDSSGNVATCSFQVSVFSACLVDDTNPGNVVLFNTTTGDFRYCCNGVVVVSGRGTLNVRGCSLTIYEAKGDRRIRITADTTANRGTAFFQKLGVQSFQITDRSMVGNACTCN